MGDAHAEHAPEGLVNPAVAWAMLGAHVVNAKGARGALKWGVVSVRSFTDTHLIKSQDFMRFAAAWATLPVNRLPEAVRNTRSPSAVRRQPASAV